MTEDQQIQALQVGVVPSARNIFLKAWQRFRRERVWPIKARFASRLYTRRLWILRECAIYRYLSANYSSIPARSATKVLIWIYNHSAIVRAALAIVEKRQLRHVINNN